MVKSRRRNLMLTAFLLFLPWQLIAGAAHATNFKLSDFVEVDRQQVKLLAPQLITGYPDARFLTSGFTTLSGRWTLVRVESSSACDEAFCATVIVHEVAEWKILVKVSKDITVSTNNEHGESTQVELMSKQGPVIVRYVGGERAIYLVR
jgi:hypothetical protein